MTKNTKPKSGTPRGYGLDDHLGSQAVIAIHKIDITGNVTPPAWYQTIQHKTAQRKPRADLEAITILAEIVYWYKPILVRDEASGQIISLRKKFKGAFLQRSYQSFATLFGLQKENVKKAFNLLEKLGLVKRHFDSFLAENGTFLANVMFIELIPAQLIEITFSKTLRLTPADEQDPHPLNFGGGGVKFDPTTTKNVSPPPPEFGGTYTEITTESPAERNGNKREGEGKRERGKDLKTPTPDNDGQLADIFQSVTSKQPTPAILRELSNTIPQPLWPHAADWLTLYKRVTNRLPKTDQWHAVLATIETLSPEQRTTDYLTPFWHAWCAIDAKRTNTDWLTDCAVNNHLPSRNGQRRAITRDATRYSKILAPR